MNLSVASHLLGTRIPPRACTHQDLRLPAKAAQHGAGGHWFRTPVENKGGTRQEAGQAHHYQSQSSGKTRGHIVWIDGKRVAWCVEDAVRTDLASRGGERRGARFQADPGDVLFPEVFAVLVGLESSSFSCGHCVDDG